MTFGLFPGSRGKVFPQHPNMCQTQLRDHLIYIERERVPEGEKRG